jgi:hypothetical protein
MEVRVLRSCDLIVREYRVDERWPNSPSLFADLSMADYVELVVEVNGRVRYHYPYRVVMTNYGELLLVRTDSYGDGRIRRHKASVCPFAKCRYLLGPLANVRFVVRVFGVRNPDPLIRVS